MLATAAAVVLEPVEDELETARERREQEERAKTKSYVRLLPLSTGPKNIKRLRKLFRYRVYTKYYPNLPATLEYLASDIRERLAENPTHVDDALAAITAELESRPAYGYANRNQDFTWEGLPAPPSGGSVRGDKKGKDRREKQKRLRGKRSV